MTWLRLAALLSWFLGGSLFALVLHVLGVRTLRDRFISWGYGVILRICRVTLEVEGRLDARRPLLLVTNHISYIDIPIIASACTVSFTPKSEIGSWPVIGFFGKVFDSVFIDRRVSKTAQNKKAIEDMLRRGRAVSLFPEGTTGNGKWVKNFRSSYFSIMDSGEETLWVQPASISYLRVNGLAVDSHQMPRIAWYGDMYLLPHILEFFRLGRVQARLRFHPPVTVREFGSRKELAAYCQRVISKDVTAKN